MSALDEALVRLDSDGKPREPSACALVAKQVFEGYGALPTPAEQEEAFRVRVRNRIESLYLKGVHAELRSFRTEWVWSGAGAFCPDEYEKADRVAREDGWLFGTVCPTSGERDGSERAWTERVHATFAPAALQAKVAAVLVRIFPDDTRAKISVPSMWLSEKAEVLRAELQVPWTDALLRGVGQRAGLLWPSNARLFWDTEGIARWQTKLAAAASPNASAVPAATETEAERESETTMTKTEALPDPDVDHRPQHEAFLTHVRAFLKKAWHTPAFWGGFKTEGELVFALDAYLIESGCREWGTKTAFQIRNAVLQTGTMVRELEGNRLNEYSWAAPMAEKAFGAREKAAEAESIVKARRAQVETALRKVFADDSRPREAFFSDWPASQYRMAVPARERLATDEHVLADAFALGLVQETGNKNTPFAWAGTMFKPAPATEDSWKNPGTLAKAVADVLEALWKKQAEGKIHPYRTIQVVETVMAQMPVPTDLTHISAYAVARKALFASGLVVEDGERHVAWVVPSAIARFGPLPAKTKTQTQTEPKQEPMTDQEQAQAFLTWWFEDPSNNALLHQVWTSALLFARYTAWTGIAKAPLLSYAAWKDAIQKTGHIAWNDRTALFQASLQTREKYANLNLPQATVPAASVPTLTESVGSHVAVERDNALRANVALSAERDKLKVDRDRLQREMAAWVHDLGQARNRVVALTDEKKRLEEGNAALVKELAVVQKDKTSAWKRNDTLLDERDQLQANLRIMTRKYEAASDAGDKLRKTHDHLLKARVALLLLINREAPKAARAWDEKKDRYAAGLADAYEAVSAAHALPTEVLAALGEKEKP